MSATASLFLVSHKAGLMPSMITPDRERAMWWARDGREADYSIYEMPAIVVHAATKPFPGIAPSERKDTLAAYSPADTEGNKE